MDRKFSLNPQLDHAIHAEIHPGVTFEVTFAWFYCHHISLDNIYVGRQKRKAFSLILLPFHFQTRQIGEPLSMSWTESNWLR